MTEITDALRMDYINSLPQPFSIRQIGDSPEWRWPVHDIAVDGAMLRIDVCGKLQAIQFIEVAQIWDANDDEHEPDSWWVDWEDSE